MSIHLGIRHDKQMVKQRTLIPGIFSSSLVRCCRRSLSVAGRVYLVKVDKVPLLCVADGIMDLITASTSTILFSVSAAASSSSEPLYRVLQISRLIMIPVMDT